jgi:hypothetical protein
MSHLVVPVKQYLYLFGSNSAVVQKITESLIIGCDCEFEQVDGIWPMHDVASVR